MFLCDIGATISSQICKMYPLNTHRTISLNAILTNFQQKLHHKPLEIENLDILKTSGQKLLKTLQEDSFKS